MGLTTAVQSSVDALFKALKEAVLEMDLKTARSQTADGLNVTKKISTVPVRVLLDDIHEDLLEDSLVGIVSKVAYFETPQDIQVGDTLYDKTAGITYTVRKFVPITLGRTELTQEVMLE